MDGLELLNALKRPVFEIGFKDAAGLALPGVSTLLNLGINVAKLGAGQATKAVGTRFADMVIEEALMESPRMVAGAGGALLLTAALTVTPDLDSWNRKDHHEFPDSYYENLYKFKPAPDPNSKPPKGDDDDQKKYIQYVLVANVDEELDDRDFVYDVMQRGNQSPISHTKLKNGDVWKYGTTSRLERRYTQKWLIEKKLRLIPQFRGTRTEVRQQEVERIKQYQQRHGKLPPGNKIIGKLRKKIKFKFDEDSIFV